MYDRADLANAASPTPEDAEDVRARAAEARQARQLALLEELADIGVEIVRAVRDVARARAEAAACDVGTPAPTPAPPFGGADLGLVYSRIARAVRQTMALETRIAEGQESARAARAGARFVKARLRAVVHQDEIRDYVAQAIEAEAVERDIPDKAVERLFDDLDTRLDEGDYDEALLNGPIGELVARICADLGVRFDCTLWQEHPWAAEHIRAQTAQTGSADIDADITAEPPATHDPPVKPPCGLPTSLPARPPPRALNGPPLDSS